ncbi:MAG TPA: efflux RND transporter permease subunit, partial [Marmoricola sp.]|nr:efflux RND transporter permease subunit [Marmoricola sp.]
MPPEQSADITKPFTDAISEAERLIRGAEFITSEQDLNEGLDYLAGRIRASLQLAFDHDLDRPILINSTHQFSRQGLDNPDAIYFHAYLRDDAIVVRENIVRHLERGEDHFTAARNGTAEIGLAVLATSMSIMAVFVPVAFMKG